MARWTPHKQGLFSQLPEGSEDVAFRKTQDGETIAEAHSAHLANQSKKFRGMFFPIPEGQTRPIVLCDWTGSISCEVVLKAFVKILYGGGPTLGSLDIKTLVGVYKLASHYEIPGLMEKLAEKIKEAKIPLAELPECLSIANERFVGCAHELKAAVATSVEKTLNSIPGKIRIMRTVLDLDFLKGHLNEILPPGVDAGELLDAYKKFLVLKVTCGDTRVPQKFSPSPLVDQVWHRHMMHPVLYKAACTNLLGRRGGELIDHDPGAAKDDPAEKWERLRRTLLVYRILFGQKAPYKIWGEVFPGPGTCQLFVKMLTGKTETFRVNLEEAVWYVMLGIEEKSGIPPDYQRLIIRGKLLEPGRAFSDYKVERNGQMENLIGAESTLHLVLRMGGC